MSVLGRDGAVKGHSPIGPILNHGGNLTCMPVTRCVRNSQPARREDGEVRGLVAARTTRGHDRHVFNTRDSREVSSEGPAR
jgi:hypothetical protein